MRGRQTRDQAALIAYGRSDGTGLQIFPWENSCGLADFPVSWRPGCCLSLRWVFRCGRDRDRHSRLRPQAERRRRPLFEYYAVDTTTGAIGPVRQARYTLDDTPPHTTSSLGDTLVRGWYHSLGPVTLTADDGAGSGVDHTMVGIDGASPTTYTGPFNFVGDSAAHTLEYFSADKLNNTEPTQTATFKIDTTPPTLSLTGSSDGDFQLHPGRSPAARRLAQPVVRTPRHHRRDRARQDQGLEHRRYQHRRLAGHHRAEPAPGGRTAAGREPAREPA